MAKTISFSPEAINAINDFCDPEELETRARLMDELEGHFLEADDVDDHAARDYARALRLLKNDLNLLLVTTKRNDDNG